VLDLAKNSDFIAVCAFAIVGLLVSASLTILVQLSTETAELLAGIL
jgi:hypothetical protein